MEDKFNTLTKIVLFKDKDGQELLNKIKDEIIKTASKSKEVQSMFK